MLDRQAFTYEHMIGKVILVGITYYTHDGDFIEQKQYNGVVEKAGEEGIFVRLGNGEALTLPPDLSSTSIAPPGEYRLRSTGEVITDPDFLSVWNIKRPLDS